MDDYNLILTKNKSVYNDIKNHLERCDTLFKPLLSSYINLEVYAKKLFEKATRYEVFYENKLIGLIAVYVSKDIGFISNFSVENEFVGKGLARQLMDFCIGDFHKQNISTISLEVFKQNLRAIKFYSKFDFNIEKEDPLRYTLVKTLNPLH